MPSQKAIFEFGNAGNISSIFVLANSLLCLKIGQTLKAILYYIGTCGSFGVIELESDERIAADALACTW